MDRDLVFQVAGGKFSGTVDDFIQRTVNDQKQQYQRKAEKYQSGKIKFHNKRQQIFPVCKYMAVGFVQRNISAGGHIDGDAHSDI